MACGILWNPSVSSPTIVWEGLHRLWDVWEFGFVGCGMTERCLWDVWELLRVGCVGSQWDM